MESDQVVVKVLGTAQDGGIPQANCQCVNCKSCEDDPSLRRLVASLAVIEPEEDQWHLLDATPDMREQLRIINRSYPRMGLMSSILLTHAHIGHYTGLIYLGKEALSTSELQVYAGEKMEELLCNHIPWKQLVDLKNIQIRPIQAAKPLMLDGRVKVLPFEVPHRNEFSKTFGMMIIGEQKKLLYIPDIDGWSLWNRNIRELASEADYCLLDGTFFSKDDLAEIGRDMAQVQHPLMTTTMDMLQDLVRNQQTKVYFTHLNHTNPAINPSSEAATLIREKGFSIAAEGMTFKL